MTDLSQTLFVSEQEIFWGEIAPTEHVLHLYTDEAMFLNMLERFAAWGLIANESVIVIATPEHRAFLDERLTAQGFDLVAARKGNQYLDMDAEECLGRFMTQGWPDDDLFVSFMNEIIARARGKGRRVRLFGEMVALLWAQGHTGATVHLERLWKELRTRAPFPLFCSYPRAGFTPDTRDSLRNICAAYTKVISNFLLSNLAPVQESADPVFGMGL